jgi:hypothetical protein
MRNALKAYFLKKFCLGFIYFLRFWNDGETIATQSAIGVKSQNTPAVGGANSSRNKYDSFDKFHFINVF